MFTKKNKEKDIEVIDGKPNSNSIYGDPFASVAKQPTPPVPPAPPKPMGAPSPAGAAPVGPKPMGPTPMGAAAPKAPAAPGFGPAAKPAPAFGPKPMGPGAAPAPTPTPATATATPVGEATPASPMVSAAPGFGQAPKPVGSPFGTSNVPPSPQMGAASAPAGFGKPASASPFGATPNFAVNQTTMTIDKPMANDELEKLLVDKKDFFPAKSVLGKAKKITYDQFCRELTFDFFTSILNSQQLLPKKPLINKIKKTLVFAMANSKDLPKGPKKLIYDATSTFIEFLKAAVYYPDLKKVDDEVIAYLPFLKEVALSFSKFLVKNK